MRERQEDRDSRKAGSGVAGPERSGSGAAGLERSGSGVAGPERSGGRREQASPGLRGLLLPYLRQHRKGFGMFLLFSAIFLVLFFLYGLPLGAVGYGAALCGFLGFLALLWDYGGFVRKCRQLELLKREVGISLDKLPQTDQFLELRYQELLELLYREKQEAVDESRRRYKDLTEYYTIWAHQIKTPISAMQLMLQREDTDASRELTEELKRISQYVEMVLVVLRLDADTTDYVIREYDLDGNIRQAVRKHATQFIYRKIQLKYEPLNVSVLTDEKWLLFVIEQVLSNALKYTKSGSVEIFMEEPKTLCIRDTGIGIAPEDLPRIFEKGYTGYNGRSDKKASGIGLYLCRRICGKLGHRIRACSAVGEGTTIRISLERRALEVE